MINAPEKISLNKRTVAYILVLLLVSILQYVPSLNNDFVWDAKGVFVLDPSIRSVTNIPRYFTDPSTLPGLADSPDNPTTLLKYYRPAMKTIHALEYAVFGVNPMGYNAVNIVLNALVVVLAFLLVQTITGNGAVALLASLLYAVNPSRVEVVSWAYSDSYIFTAIFSFLSFHLYHRGTYGASIGIFAVSLFIHETAALMPVIIVLYEFLIQKRKTMREFAKTVPFFLVLGIFLIIRRSIVGTAPLTHLDMLPLANSVAVIIKRYVKLLIIPDAPVTIYGYARGMFSVLSPEVIISYVVLLGLTAFGVYLWFKRKEHLFWYLWFFLFCAVSFNVGEFGEYLMAEKLLYTASLGFCVLLALPVATARQGKVFLAIVFASLIVYHFGTTIDRQRYWKSTSTYLEAALTFAPDFAFGHMALASEYQVLHDYDRSLAEYRKTLVLQPDILPIVRDPIAYIYYLKGNDLSLANEYGKALEEYQIALSWKPDHSPSYNSIGIIYQMEGKRDKAVQAWEMAIQSDPSNASAYYNMGAELQSRGDLKAALAYYQRYLTLDQNPLPSVKILFEQLQKKSGK